MPITIESYTADHEPAVAAFNARLAPQTAPVPFRFPERHVSGWLPPGEGRRVFMEAFLAVEDGGTVRGGYWLKTQDFWLDGRVQTVGNLQLPLSEGVVDPHYRFLGMQLIRDALARQPLLFALGMGGEGETLPRLLKALGWVTSPVPFFFRVIRPARFFRGIAYLRRSLRNRILCDLLAMTGAGWLGVRAAQAAVARERRASNRCRVDHVNAAAAWVDEVWEAAHASYRLTAVRDGLSLASLYGGGHFPTLRVLRAERNGRTIGWAAVLDSPMNGHRYFGDLKVGSIVDGFAAPDAAAAVVAAATDFLERRGVDLIVSNQAHPAWQAALRRSGFLNGPSNFLFAMSKPLAAQVSRDSAGPLNAHINRGDGDGPINL